MRIDLIESGSQDIDIEFNGRRIDGVVWADDVTGECEVFEQHWFTQERLTDENGPMGYQTLKLKGTVKITDRRKPQYLPDCSEDRPFDPYRDMGMCILRVMPARMATDRHLLQVLDLSGTPLSESWVDGSHGVKTLASVVLQRLAKYSYSHIEVETRGVGAAVLDEIRQGTTIKVYPL
jgi:hypothetical protein